MRACRSVLDMTTAAAQKRFDGIRRVTELAIDPENGFQVRPEITVGKMIKAIEELRKLGRTERWSKALTQWQEMIKGCDEEYYVQSDPWKRHMHWAVLQGNVYAGYAAD